MNIKRNLVDLAEAVSGARIIKNPEKIGLAFEELYLKRFFSHFQIDCVFDVGANAGQYVELLRDRVGFKGPIISFEPIPKMVQLLREKAKGDPHWYIEPIALDKAAGEAVFNVMTKSDFSSLLSPKYNENNMCDDQNKIVQSITVVTSTLKIEYLKYKEKLGFSSPFLKMDTQGNDVTIFQSAEEIVNEIVGLQSELAIKRLYENTLYFHEAISFYQSKGFELSALLPNHPWHFPYLVEVDCIMFRSTASPEWGA